MKHLWITIGVPGCGKTTWVKNQINKIGGLHISRDAIRFELLNDNDEYFDKENEVFEHFILMIKLAIKDSAHENIFIDATHLNENSRNKLLSRLNLTDVDAITWVNFQVPLEIALARNEKRTGRALVPRSVIRRMNEQKDIRFIKLDAKTNIITIDENGKEVIR